MDAIYLTEQEYQKLENELYQLKRVEMPKIIQAIATAREHGDLKENAEYHAAKEKQVLIQNKINRLEEMHLRVRIIDPDKVEHSVIHVGSKVTLQNVDTGSKMTCVLGSTAEFNLYDDMDVISMESPVGKAIVGKSEGDSIEVDIPSGKLKFKVIEVK
ncbi:transcription elongation factor GreA [candidate division KSB1 bacterium]|nr:transcription elongation factor GreA [candidate division KSB1 bacterium]